MKHLLRLYALSAFFIAATLNANAQCTDIFISEYVEGSGFNKALELYNPTANPINLSNYRLAQYNNGSSTVGPFTTLSGTIAAYGTWVIVLDKRTGSPTVDADLQAKANVFINPTNTAEVMYFNGNDAIVLQRTNGTVVDIFGKVGQDPGTGWGTGGATANHTLIRKSTVTQGVTTSPATFDPTVEWTIYAQDLFDSLGMHKSACLPSCNLAVTANGRNVSCGGTNDGRAAAVVTGGTAPFTFAWSGGTPNTAGDTINNLAANTYTVTVTDANNCTATASVLITIPQTAQQPTQITGPDAICAGTFTYSVVSVSGETYTWAVSGGGTVTPSGNQASIVWTTQGTHTVSVTASTVCGNAPVQTLQVTVTTLPDVPVISGDNSVCRGDMATYSVPTVSGVTYTWSVSGGGSVSPNGSTADITWTTNGNFTVSVTATNQCGTSNAATFAVAVNSPAVNLGNDTTACGPVTLTANGFASVLWSNNATTNQITVTQNGNVGVTVTDNQGCQASDNINIVVNTPASLTLPTTASDCDTAVVTATGSFTTYLWSNGENTATGHFTQNGNYTITATDANGCEATGTVAVTIYPAPTLNLPATASGCGSVQVTGANGFTIYSWSDGQTTATATFTQGGTYTLTVTDANGCQATDNIVVTVTPGTPLNLPATADGCSTASVTAPNGYTNYTWSNGQTTATGTFTQNGAYTLTATDANGCNVVDTVAATIFPVPATGVPATAQGCGSADVAATAGLSSYLWSDGQTTQTASFTAAGTYSVTVTSADGCTASSSTNVTLNSGPIADFNQSSNELDVDFTFNGSGADSYAWDFGNGATSTDANPSVTYAAEGSYTVTLTVTNACGTSTTSETVTVTTIGIQELKALSNVNIFPNPTNSQLQVNWGVTQGNVVLEVYNSMGARVLTTEGSAANGTQALNVQDLTNGMYLLRIQLGSESKLVKFVKE